MSLRAEWQGPTLSRDARLKADSEDMRAPRKLPAPGIPALPSGCRLGRAASRPKGQRLSPERAPEPVASPSTSGGSLLCASFHTKAPWDFKCVRVLTEVQSLHP